MQVRGLNLLQKSDLELDRGPGQNQGLRQHQDPNPPVLRRSLGVNLGLSQDSESLAGLGLRQKRGNLFLLSPLRCTL